ncbi:MAG: AAA family ATPase [Alphaproteobacteria bacterium]
MQRDPPGNPDQTVPAPWDQTEAQGLTAICVNELIKKDIPVREEWLSPWLRAQDLVMVHAPRGGSKTFFVLSVGLAVASGGGLLGWSAGTPRRVLLVDGEMPARTMQERSHGLIMANKLEPQPDYLKIITPDLQGQSIPDLSTAEGQALIEQHLVGPSLLILDNLSTLCRSGVENEAESWLPVQEWALSLRRRGHSALFVHHSGKSGLQRGTSRREDTLDVIIGLRRPSNYMAQDGARFEVHFEKARGLYGDVIRPLEAQLHSGTDGTMTWTYKTVEEGTAERVAELVEEGLTQRDIAIELGISTGKVNRLVKQARGT